MSRQHTITLIPGDGIGPEVTNAVVRIIEGAGAATGAVAGGIFGLLVGVGVLVFPAVGLVAAGPVAAMLATR